MLGGVIITSYVTERFTKMIEQLTGVNSNFEESDELSYFFGSIEKFNGNLRLSSHIYTDFEDYFQYRWEKNRNHAICTQSDEDLLDQLPKSVQIQIYTEYLFKDFAQLYDDILLISEKSTRNRKNKYKLSLLRCLEIENHQEFLISLIRHLEP